MSATRNAPDPVKFVEPRAPEAEDAGSSQPGEDDLQRIYFKVTYKEETVGPKKAEEYLATMKNNRLPKKNSIASSVTDIATEHWYFTGEPIIFDWFGQLVDGQNRLSAVVRSGKPIRVLVVRGIDPAAVKAIDTGVSRNLGDILRLEVGSSMIKGSRVSSVATRMYRLDEKNEWISKRSGSPSKQIMLEYTKRHLDEILSACAFESPGNIATLMTPVTYGTVRIVLRRIDFHAAEDFLWQLINGTVSSQAETYPITTLRNRLIKDRKQTIHMSSAQGAGIAREWSAGEIQQLMIFIAWGYWREGKPLGRIILPRDPVTNYPVPR